MPVTWFGCVLLWCPTCCCGCFDLAATRVCVWVFCDLGLFMWFRSVFASWVVVIADCVAIWLLLGYVFVLTLLIVLIGVMYIDVICFDVCLLFAVWLGCV